MLGAWHPGGDCHVGWVWCGGREGCGRGRGERGHGCPPYYNYRLAPQVVYSCFEAGRGDIECRNYRRRCIVIVAFDCETGGLCPERNRILSFAMVDVATDESWYITLQPEGDLDPKAMEVNGLSVDSLKADGADRAWALGEIAFRLSKAEAAWAHNAPFDVSMLEADFARHGIPSPFKRTEVYCSGLWFRHKMGIVGEWPDGRKKIPSLKKVWDQYGGPDLGPEYFNGPSHGAEDDARAVAILVSAVVFDPEL